MHFNRRAIVYLSLSFTLAFIMSVGLLQLSQSTAQSAAMQAELPPANTLVITKTVEGGAADSAWEFIVQGSGIYSTVQIPGAGGSDSLILPYGSYTVTELAKEGYWVSDSGCLSQLGVQAAINGSLNVAYAYVDEVGDACSFTNNKYASLTVKKEAIPDSDQPFQFALKSSYEITPTPFTLVDDGLGISNTKTFTDLMDNTYYEIRALEPNGWAPGGVICEDSNGPLDRRDTFVSAVLEEPKPTLISWPLFPEAGETYTCTFTNLGAQLTLTKTVTTEPEECAPVSLDSCVFPGTELYYCYEVENTGAVTLTTHSLVDNVFGDIFTDLSYDLVPGAKVNSIDAGHVVTDAPTVSVTNIATWTGVYTYTPMPVLRLSGAQIQPSIVYDGLQEIYVVTGTVSVSDTASVDVCEPSRIVVDKVTTPVDNEQVFDFAFGHVTEPPTPAIPFTVTETLNYTTPDLKPGVYSVAEQTLPTGWTADGSPVCTDDAGAPYDASAIDLPAGVTVTCVFRNRYEDPTALGETDFPDLIPRLYLPQMASGD